MKFISVFLLVFSSLCFGDSVVLTWTPSTTANPVRQSIYRQINCTSITSIPTPVRRAEVGPGVETWTDTTAKAGEKYCYFVTVSAKTSKASTTTIESGPSVAILVTAN
jgi:hypothetical protein